MDYDAELRLLDEVLRLAYGVERHDRVLDVGCGAGQTTREAARMAAEGSALGIDLSAEAITGARIFFGRDVAAALEWVRGFTCTQEALAGPGTPSADRALVWSNR